MKTKEKPKVKSKIKGRSFNLFLPYAIKKSKFRHYIYSMHELMDHFTDSKNFYYNILYYDVVDVETEI